MQKPNYSLVFLCLFGISLLIACTKDDASKAVIELLTGGSSRKWRQVENKINDSIQVLDPCEADDLLIFYKTGSTFLIDKGTLHCDSMESNASGTWGLADTDKKLNLMVTDSITHLTDTLAFELIDPTDSKLKIKRVINGISELTTFEVVK